MGIRKAFFNGVVNHFRQRFNEWVSSAAMLLWGTGILMNKDSLVSLGMFDLKSAFIFGILCITVGVARSVLLIINGAWGVSPHLRVLASGISACTWTILWTTFFDQNYIFLALSMGSVVVLLDMYSLWYAAEDAKASDLRKRVLLNVDTKT